MNALQCSIDALEPRLLFTTLYWLGGSGNWNDANWNTESDGSGSVVAWTSGDDARFENGSAITVTLSGSTNVNSITFGSGGAATLTGGTITGSPQFTVDSPDVTVNSIIAGSSGLNVYHNAGGTITFTGANTYTGTTNIADGGQTEFTGDALAALPNCDTTTYLAQMDISGTVSWTGTDFTAGYSSTITISGNLTISGGTWDFDDSSTLAVTGSLTISGGTLTTADLENSGTVTLTSGSLTLNGSETTGANSAYGTIQWTGGGLTISSGTFLNDGLFLMDGGSNSLALSGSGTLDNQGGPLYWYSGNVSIDIAITNDDGGDILLQGGSDALTLAGGSIANGNGSAATVEWNDGVIAATGGGSITNDDAHGATFTSSPTAAFLSGMTFSGTLTNTGTLTIEDGLTFANGTLLNEGGTVYIDMGSGTLTLDDSSLTNGDSGAGTLEWDSGKIVLTDGGSVANDDADGASFTIPTGYEVSLDTTGGSVTGTISNEGTLQWTGTGMTAIANIDNSGTVILEGNDTLSGLTLSGGNYELSTGHTATVASTLTINGATFTVDSDATLDWTGGNISIGTSGSLDNYGTFSISTTGNFTGTVGAAGLTDYSSLGSQVTTQVKDLVEGVTAPDFTGSGPAYDWSATIAVQIFTDSSRDAYNSACWSGDADLTGIPLSCNATLITPRDMLFAAHTLTGTYADGHDHIGAPITFRDNDNNWYILFIGKITIIADSDVAIVTLVDAYGNPEDAPSSITPMKLLPADYADYILNSSQTLAVAYTNQDRTLLVGQYDGTSSGVTSIEKPADATLSEFTYPTGSDPLGIVRGGDSGSPVMVLVNGQFALMGNWWFRSSATLGGISDDASYISAINSAIATNAAALSVTAYTVSTVDLSGSTNYSALLS